MSGVEAPYTIASLARPLDADHGRTQAAAVWSLRGARKSKRHEVVVGIDGETVNIYNIQSQNLVASYALPPQCYLCCPPLSIYQRASTDVKAQRRTYLVVKDATESAKQRLVCFSEDVQKKRASNGDLSPPEKKECKLSDGELVNLDVVRSGPDQRYSIIVSYKDGALAIVSDDLAKTQHEDRPTPYLDDSSEVEYGTIMNAETARQALLKGRDDIIALLDQMHTATAKPNLLCRFTRSDEGRQLELYTISDPHTRIIQTNQPSLQLIMSYDLPSSGKHPSKPATYELHAPSGKLYQLIDGRLCIYDLTGTLPKLVMKFGGKIDPVTSFARVSTTSIMTTLNDSATVLETAYGSVQASIPFSSGISSEKSNRKRKRGDSEEQAPSLSLISSFADLDLAVGLRQSKLVAMQLNEGLRATKRRKSTLLSSVMGKGGMDRSHNSGNAEKSAKKWDEWSAKIDALVDEEDFQALDVLIAHDPALGRQQKLFEEAYIMSEGDETAYYQLWPLPQPFDPQRIDKRKVLYIFTKMFTRGDQASDVSLIESVSAQMLEWMALTGFLSVEYLEKAFQTFAGISSSFKNSGIIMRAVRAIDDDFEIMNTLISLPVHWNIEEVVEALRLQLKSFDTSRAIEPRLALPAPPQTNGEAHLANGDAEEDVELESKAAETELKQAIMALTSGLETRSTALREIIARLNAFPQQTITTTMRAMMSHREIIFFIHILRIELADGGWTSQYIDAAEPQKESMVNQMAGVEESGPSDQAIKVIGKLLNCAVDAVGTSGWLVGQGRAQLGIGDLIGNLKIKVRAGLEGCWEADKLDSLLAELEKFSGSGKKKKSLSSPLVLDNDDGMDEGQRFLPMGPPQAPLPIQSRGGNRSRKARDAIAKQRSRSLGNYRLEHIRL